MDKYLRNAFEVPEAPLNALRQIALAPARVPMEDRMDQEQLQAVIDNPKYCEDCHWCVEHENLVRRGLFSSTYEIELRCGRPYGENLVERGHAERACRYERCELSSNPRYCGAEGRYWRAKE